MARTQKNTYRKRKKKRAKAKKGAPAISPRTRNALLAGAAAVALVVGGWWAYMALTTVPPPKLADATPQKVAQYLGNSRGFARLSIPEREQFLANTFQHFDKYEDRLALNKALRRMSHQEQEVVLNATLDVVQTRVMDLAEQYNRQPTQRAKTAFAQKALGNFQAMQAKLGGGGNPNLNVGKPFKPFMPQTSEQWQKMLVTRTTPSERAKARPLLEEMVKQDKHKDQPAGNPY